MLAELEERLPTGKARAAAMQHRMPIHSFLFDQQGLLLHANQAATRRWSEKGKLHLRRQVIKQQTVMRKQVPMLLRGRNPSLYVPNDGEEGDGVWTRYTRAVLSGPPSFQLHPCICWPQLGCIDTCSLIKGCCFVPNTSLPAGNLREARC